MNPYQDRQTTDRQTDRQADRQTDRQAKNRQTGRRTDRQTGRQAGRQGEKGTVFLTGEQQQSYSKGNDEIPKLAM